MRYTGGVVAAPPPWLAALVQKIKSENAQVITFNWDLVLDQLLFGRDLDKGKYGFGSVAATCRLLKPHGSLNWYERGAGKFINRDKIFSLAGSGEKEVFAFKPFRAPNISSRRYMPLIVPPVYSKQFRSAVFTRIWRETVAVIGSASHVKVLGYSLAEADFHARFILRCGLHNQIEGHIIEGGRSTPTGRSEVVIVDPSEKSIERVESAVGWGCRKHIGTIENWVGAGGLA